MIIIIILLCNTSQLVVIEARFRDFSAHADACLSPPVCSSKRGGVAFFTKPIRVDAQVEKSASGCQRWMHMHGELCKRWCHIGRDPRAFLPCPPPYQPVQPPFIVLHRCIRLRPRCFVRLPIRFVPLQPGSFSVAIRAHIHPITRYSGLR
jgi:hypothetical protein